MIIAIILAAGRGTRIRQAKCPKQYIEIEGKSILCHTVEKFLACSLIDHIVIALHPDWITYTETLFAGMGNGKIVCCTGADNRQKSLYQALRYCQKALSAPDDTIILSHDAARPFVSLDIIKANIHAMQHAQAVNTVIPVTDTIIQSINGRVMSATTERNWMYQVQTPQTFRLGQFLSSYRKLNVTAVEKTTDAIGILYQDGIPVYLVNGEKKNFKITTDEDLALAEYCLKQISDSNK